MHRRHSAPAAARTLKIKTLAVAIAAGFATAAFANPVGPTVAAGGASFATSGNTLAIVNTPGTIINWQQFNIGQNEITKFIQPSNQSTVLNRITGQDPSQILGTLQSNGRVFLVNPNGILFGQNAVIDVFGLVASNLNLANADFLAGRFSFNGGGAGAVVNQGAITTPVGGSVYLVGSSVANQGLITSPKGDVLLAAGDSVSLADTGTPNMSVTLNAGGNKAVNLGRITADGGRIDIYGALIEQQGVLRADSAAVDAQGRIVLKATQSTSVAGEISATNGAGGGGTVQVLGDDVALTSSAKIDASGASGGGTVLIGGDRQGANAAVHNATTTRVAAGATIKADATDTGNGGKVIVWSKDKTFFDGLIYARGGANGGDGGFVETSGKTLSLGGHVDTTAAKGRTGNWLLDPASYCFYLSSSSECISTGFDASNGWSMDAFNSLLTSSDLTVAATDYAAFLPAGGSFVGSSSVPAGHTLTVQAPYIYSNGYAESGLVNLVLDASSQYGTSSKAGKTGVIDIAGGIIRSTANQTLSASADINIGSATATSVAGLDMTSGAGTQSITAAGNLNVISGSGVAEGFTTPVQAYISSRGSQTISASNITLTAGTGSGTPVASSIGTLNNAAYIFTYGASQSITASQAITVNGGASGTFNQAYIEQWNSNGVQTVNATNLTLKGGGSGSADYGDMATIRNTSATGKQTISISGGGSVTLIGGDGSGITTESGISDFSTVSVSHNGAEIRHSGSGAQTLDFLAGGSLRLTGGNDGSLNWAQIYSKGPLLITSSNGSAHYPSITLTSGTGGYFDSYGEMLYNGAGINTSDHTGAALIINADSITLNGGGTSTLHGLTQIESNGALTITTTGAVTLNGGNGGSPPLSSTLSLEDGQSGSAALIGSETSLTLKVGTDLTVQAAGGSSALTLLGSEGSMNLSVGGKTTISASASPVFIGAMPGTLSIPVAAGLVEIAPSSTSPFQTGALSVNAKTIRIDGPVMASGSMELYGDAVSVNAPVTAGSYFASVAGTFDLAGTITANGSAYNNYFGAQASSTGKYLEAGVWVDKGFTNHGGAIQTPNGYWVVVLDAGVTGATNAVGTGMLTKSELLSAGYHWAGSTAETDTASGDYHFYVPVEQPSSLIEQQAVARAVTDTCATNPTLCASSQQQQATVAAIDATAEPGSASKGKLTVDEKLKDGKTAKKAEEKKTEEKKVAEDKKQPEDKKQAEQKKAEVSKQKQEAKAAEERKSPAELKQEAKQAQAEAKKVEAEAKQAQTEAKKVEAEAKQAASVAKKAEAEGKKAETEAKKADAEIKAAKTPERKAGAEARKAEAESKQAEAESKQIGAESKQAQAASKKVEAESKQAAHDAKQAEAEHKLALADAKEAKSPEAKAAAQSKAADKQVEATRKKAEGEVKQSRAEEHKVAATQKKVEAEAKQAERDAKHAEAGAKKAEAEAVRAKQAGKPGEEKKALVQKADHEKQAEASQKHAEAKHAEANAKKAEHDKMAAERRGQAAKAFAGAALAAMMPDRLAQMAALRHEFKTELLKPALTVLEQNPKAADMPPCGAGSGDVCVPVKAAVAETAGKQAAPVAVALPKPTLSFVPQIERKVAVLVGINNYADKNIPPLESAVPDVDAIGKVMQEKLGYEVRIVRDATKADIVKAINGVGKEVGPNDSVAIYYAGHGYLSEKTNTGYWIPSDSSVLNPGNWISNDDIARLLQQIPAKQLMLVSDSCYSGSLTREAKVGAGTGNVNDILGKRSVTVMSSGGEEPVSDEGKAGHSIFAWTLMDSLKKVDRYEHGAKIFDNVKRGVVEEFPQVPQYGAATSAGHAAGGDYLLEVRSYK